MNLTAVGDDPRLGHRVPVRHVALVPAGVEPQRLARSRHRQLGDHGHRHRRQGVLPVERSTPTSSSTSRAGSRPGASYHAFAPVRALDTRDAGPAVAPGTIREVPIAGQFGVPAAATAVSVNVTAVNATGPAWVKVFPCGTAAARGVEQQHVTGSDRRHAGARPDRGERLDLPRGELDDGPRRRRPGLHLAGRSPGDAWPCHPDHHSCSEASRAPLRHCLELCPDDAGMHLRVR